MVNRNNPIPNMRRLKRIPGEKGLVFTLETEAERQKDNLICNYCAMKLGFEGFQPCAKFEELVELSGKGVSAIVRTCNMYQPILTFRPPFGNMEGDFNTFRLGTAWYNRVSPGTVVGLLDVTTGLVFGKATVTAVYHGDLDEMCSDHAMRNHLFLGTDPEDAASKMAVAVRQAYGRLIQTNNANCCVLDLRRL